MFPTSISVVENYAAVRLGDRQTDVSIVVLEDPRDHVASNGQLVTVYLVNLVPFTSLICISLLQENLQGTSFVKGSTFPIPCFLLIFMWSDVKIKILGNSCNCYNCLSCKSDSLNSYDVHLIVARGSAERKLCERLNCFHTMSPTDVSVVANHAAIKT